MFVRALLVLLGSVSGFGQFQFSTTKIISGAVKRDELRTSEESITVTARGGVLQSQGYPRKYPRHVQNRWNLSSPLGTQILLEFSSPFGLEGPEKGSCRYDSVVVKETTESSTILWGCWCGDKVPPTVTSKANQLTVIFTSDLYIIEGPGFRAHYSMLYKHPSPQRQLGNDDALMDDGVWAAPAAPGPVSMDELDQTISAFDTVEQLFWTLNPYTWRQDLDIIYNQKPLQYRSRNYLLANRLHKVDLNRLHDDVKRYSCTPRNHSVNLREELRTTSAVFFPRCLLVQRCGGNCGCGTDQWNTGCVCQATKSTAKMHEVLKYTPEMGAKQRYARTRLRWVLSDVTLTHHERCECACSSRPPR